METVGVIEAESHLRDLLDRVELGESFMITRHGKPAAQLIPTDSTGQRSRSEVIADLLEFGRGRKLEGASIREMIGEGRRF